VLGRSFEDPAEVASAAVVTAGFGGEISRDRYGDWRFISALIEEISRDRYGDWRFISAH
jgi:hypothetical protein